MAVSLKGLQRLGGTSLTLALVACGPVVEVSSDDGGGSTHDEPPPNSWSTSNSTPPSVTGLAASAEPTVGAGSTEGSTDAPQVPTPVARYALHQVLYDAPWHVDQTTGGIAVDDQNRVFVADQERVYMVVGEEVSVWHETSGFTDRVRDVDVHDGVIWILTDQTVLRSTAPGISVVEHDLSELVFVHHLGVVSGEEIAITHRNEGLWLATPQGLGPTLLEDELMGGTSCAAQDLAVSKTGRFLYQPGCNGSPLVLGDVQGGPTEVFFEDDFTYDDIYWNALCSTGAPGSGFYSVTYSELAPVLHYVPEEPGSELDWRVVPTSPSLGQLEDDATESFAFRYCGISVAPDDTLFLQTRSQLWRGDPEY